MLWSGKECEARFSFSRWMWKRTHPILNIDERIPRLILHVFLNPGQLYISDHIIWYDMIIVLLDPGQRLLSFWTLSSDFSNHLLNSAQFLAFKYWCNVKFIGCKLTPQILLTRRCCKAGKPDLPPSLLWTGHKNIVNWAKLVLDGRICLVVNFWAWGVSKHRIGLWIFTKKSFQINWI